MIRLPTVAVTSPDQFRWRVFAIMLAATLAAVTTFWLAAPPTYLTNDDVAIRRDLEGLSAPGAAPTGYVLMAHSALGWALVWARHFLPAHSWDFVVAGLLIVSIAVLLANAWSASRAMSDRLLSAGAIVAAVVPLLAGLQFTISATLAGVAAMMTASTELLMPRPRRAVLAAAGVLFVVGVLVRPMGATAGALVTAGLTVPVALSVRELRAPRIRRIAAAAALVAISAVLLVYLDGVLYRLSPEWNAYHRDNWMLAWFFEWGGDLPADVVEPLRAHLGWSVNDWELLRRFWGIDPVLHSHARIETLYDAWSATVGWRLGARWLLQRAAGEMSIGTFVRLLSESRVSLFVAALVTLAFASGPGLRAALASTGLFYAVCAVIEVVFKELPARLFAPLQVSLIVAAIITCTTLRRPRTTILTALCAAAAIGLAAHQFRLLRSDALADARQSTETDAQVLELLQQHPSLLVLHADSFPSEYWWRPFHNPPARLVAIQLGMNNHNPYVQKVVANYHGKPLLHAICNDPAILVIAERGRLDPVTAFVKQHDGMNVRWDEVYSGSFRAWRCSSTGTW